MSTKKGTHEGAPLMGLAGLRFVHFPQEGDDMLEVLPCFPEVLLLLPSGEGNELFVVLKVFKDEPFKGGIGKAGQGFDHQLPSFRWIVPCGRRVRRHGEFDFNGYVFAKDAEVDVVFHFISFH